MSAEALAPPNRARQALLLASPLAVVAIGHLTARIAGRAIGDAAWVPLTLVFWLTLVLLIRAAGGMAACRRWAGPALRTRRTHNSHGAGSSTALSGTKYKTSASMPLKVLAILVYAVPWRHS